MTGSAVIDGTLVVRLVANYVPPVGQEFVVLTAASVSGQFGKFDVAGAIAGRAFDVRYDSNAVIVVTTLATGLQYATWKSLAFVAADEANMAISGPGADPDGDGLVNLIEYAFGLNPQQPDDSPLLPAVFQDAVSGQTFLTLSFPWADGTMDLEYQVSVSSDLQNWASAGTEVISAEQSEGLKQVRLKVVPPPLSNAEHLFARLEVRHLFAAQPQN